MQKKTQEKYTKYVKYKRLKNAIPKPLDIKYP